LGNEIELTEGDEEDHPDTDIDLTTTIPVLKDSTGRVDIVRGDEEIFQEIIVPKSESDGGVHETGGIPGEATLMGNIGGHFTERNHDKVADESDEAVPKKKTERAASRRTEVRFEQRILGSWRRLTGREPFRIR
jgi:hypothetical protein